jgi:hypothetical protein
LAIDYSNLPFAKPSHKRLKPTRKNFNTFSTQTIKEIFERDHWRCVRCGTASNLESVPHHVEYRSAMGGGSKRNGITVCRYCHDWFHASKKKHNIWAVQWVEEHLNEEGNYKKLPQLLKGDASDYS